MTTPESETPLTDALTQAQGRYYDDMASRLNEHVELSRHLERALAAKEAELAAVKELLQECRDSAVSFADYGDLATHIDAAIQSEGEGRTHPALDCGDCGLSGGWQHDLCPRCGRRP